MLTGILVYLLIVAILFTPIMTALGIYGICWGMEELGWIDDNPIETFYHGYLLEWLDNLTYLDIVRVPLVYFEYQVTWMIGADDFDVNDPNF